MLVAGCGFLGEDNKGGDNRGSESNNEGAETRVLDFEQHMHLAAEERMLCGDGHVADDVSFCNS